MLSPHFCRTTGARWRRQLVLTPDDIAHLDSDMSDAIANAEEVVKEVERGVGDCTPHQHTFSANVTCKCFPDQTSHCCNNQCCPPIFAGRQGHAVGGNLF
jgi:hypothetical protein